MLLSESLSNEKLVELHTFKQTLPMQSVESKKKYFDKVRSMNLTDRLNASLKQEN